MGRDSTGGDRPRASNVLKERGKFGAVYAHHPENRGLVSTQSFCCGWPDSAGLQEFAMGGAMASLSQSIEV
jgi:hypothetical protein